MSNEEKPVNTQCGGDKPKAEREQELPKIYIPDIVKQAVTEKMIQIQESMDKETADLSELNIFLRRFT